MRFNRFGVTLMSLIALRIACQTMGLSHDEFLKIGKLRLKFEN